MSPEAAKRRHRREAQTVKRGLRELNTQLALLNRRFGGKVELRDVDWTCLDLINLHGPLTPTVLARKANLHPATLTGILDRLERGGWVVRERDPQATDRRAVTVRALGDRNHELYGLFAGMVGRMDALCEEYSAAELELIAGFLRRAAQAGRDSADELGD
ncbi:MarR family transcriptional regulator [Nocardia bhagyanarayanae]|uniref:DNA-binding MarR family transcriptional regulator n=1 Tax=Nocardia bhagyanarayanae TaxID=1215925 RepID=A0A543FIJ6_9NOCA|nr:MarR family transcriptional regulator [Nocardia bhagyanarayanae]TQM33683.1 DNA-binding MarR family transcriptional regulator [Nocardia bhagyanarayanae]